MVHYTHILQSKKKESKVFFPNLNIPLASQLLVVESHSIGSSAACLGSISVHGHFKWSYFGNDSLGNRNPRTCVSQSSTTVSVNSCWIAIKRSAWDVDKVSITCCSTDRNGSVSVGCRAEVERCGGLGRVTDGAVAALSSDADLEVLIPQMLCGCGSIQVTIHAPAAGHSSEVHGASSWCQVVGVTLKLAGKNIPLGRGRAGSQTDCDGCCVGGGGPHVKVHMVAR